MLVALATVLVAISSPDYCLLMSDKITGVVGHNVGTNFFIVNHFMATMNKNLSNHNFVLSDQDGVLVGHMSFQVKEIICSPVTLR